VRLRLPDGKTEYDVRVDNPRRRAAAVTAVLHDGAPVEVADGIARVALVADGRPHAVRVTLGPAQAPSARPSASKR
jgi:hypothetical protein